MMKMCHSHCHIACIVNMFTRCFYSTIANRHLQITNTVILVLICNHIIVYCLYVYNVFTSYYGNRCCHWHCHTLLLFTMCIQCVDTDWSLTLSYCLYFHNVFTSYNSLFVYKVFQMCLYHTIAVDVDGSFTLSYSSSASGMEAKTNQHKR